ncbi:DivIVA domain-containing protein [uncultured Pseudokineococcus sp.]|uniref:DivIVA domain-containing protein n=1 Tax=uncultured Pseudokineococcus sp. TaxID=1642928 RepID=UPI002615E2C2|nr:DivIVA domain-containing protein [uncultured Pseudokineococcus sp.]
MALTPEAVTGRTFTVTKFREGYDQHEIDDFLDEVVTELTRLHSESAHLREQLAAAERRADEASAPVREPADAGAPVAAAPVPVQVAPADDQPAPDVEATASVPDSAAGVLALAQRLHEEHVRAGEQEHDRLVTGAREEADRLVGEAQEQRRTTLEQLEEQRASEIGALEHERTLLERKIDELRGFEREYRSRLRAYLETQLRDLDGTAAVVPGSEGATPGGLS